MPEVAKVGLHLAKNVFQAHGSDVSGRAVVRKKPMLGRATLANKMARIVWG